METKRIYAHADGKLLFDFKLSLDGAYVADAGILHYLAQHQLCEPEVVYLMVRAIRPGDTVIDGGANIGYFTLLMSHLVGPTGRVIAFEPAPDNWQKLQANLVLNNVTNVESFNAALWDTPLQTKRFYLSGEDQGQHTLGVPARKTSEKSITVVTDTIGRHNVSPRLVKLDIEGAEEAALRGINFREQFPHYIITELNEAALEQVGSTQDSLRSYSYARGYNCWLLHADGNLPTFVPTGTRIKPTQSATNVLFSRPAFISELYPTVQI